LKIIYIIFNKKINQLFMFISLGGNCSVTYQLDKYFKRSIAFPFDWCKIKIKQLINILENNFENYIETLNIKKYSQSHSSYTITNKYNITYAHELFNDINDYKDKIKRRIDRFCNLENKYINFIRIELQPINSKYINLINKLVELLKKYSENFKILILIEQTSYNLIDQNNISSYVELIPFNSFSENWKMEHVNWKFILDKKII